MPQTCPKCHRANPADALYCYEDGFSLGGRAGQAGPVDPGQQPFPHPFVFPNGAACRNFDQLALACHNEWVMALELMRTATWPTSSPDWAAPIWPRPPARRRARTTRTAPSTNSSVSCPPTPSNRPGCTSKRSRSTSANSPWARTTAGRCV